jgi:hypothetical protein
MEDEGRELEEPQEDYEYDAADINANQHNDYDGVDIEGRSR